MLLKKHFLTVIAVLLGTAIASSQPITRQVAISMVKNQIIGGDFI